MVKFFFETLTGKLLIIILPILIALTGSSSTDSFNQPHYNSDSPDKDEIIHLIDSLEKAYEKRRRKELAEGYVAAGPVDLNLHRLIDYNRYEGFKPGIGIRSGDEISQLFTSELFYNRSLRSNYNNYGSSVTFHLSSDKKRKLNIFAEKSLFETGSYSLLGLPKPYSNERFEKYAIKTVDRTTAAGASLEFGFSGKLKYKIGYSYRDVEPILTYPYLTGREKPEPAFYNHEGVVRFNWNPKQNNKLKLWSNFIYGKGAGENTFSYLKTEFAAEQRVSLSERVTTNIRAVSGYISGSFKHTHLYSAFGTYNNGLGIHTSYSFATMRPNEFAADKFALLFIKTEIPLEVNSQFINPVIIVSTSAAIGSVKSKNKELINSFSKGYYESGVYLSRLLKHDFLHYGVSFHYRYGPYNFNNRANNWAVKLGIEIDL
ncbi:hypothetical protein QA597_05060 [Marinilabiliaceae bacterium ANBcel2]|nr:hypothetical protein [Marinilabiliaceae bacterium ANBcel2]